MNSSQLAINSGSPVFPDGPPPWPIADDRILNNVRIALADGSWGRYDGPWTEQLIEQVSILCGCDHVLLCSSGTIAVEIALRGLDVKPETEVILAAYDFPGNFRAVEAIGARPVIVDVVEGGWVIDPDEVAGAITPLTSAVIVSHLHGQVADCNRIRKICDEHQIAFLEDACQMPGGAIDSNPIGSSGDVGVFSFGGSKLLSAGRGGALATRDADIYQRAKIFCNRGNEVFPLSQLQASVLIPQIEILEGRNKTRFENATRLLERTHNIAILDGLSQVVDDADLLPTFYKLPWLIDDVRGHWTRGEFIRAAQAEGVAVDVGFRGFMRRSAKRCRQLGALINSRVAAQQTIILHHPVLLESEAIVDKVAEALAKVAAAES